MKKKELKVASIEEKIRETGSWFGCEMLIG